MFGYIRPLQGELKLRDFERFKAKYCGLCHTLGRKYGMAARFALSYEPVFLSMLIYDEDETPVFKQKRCIASPVRKRRYCTTSKSLDICAGYCVILAWWKLRDTIADETFFRKIPHKAASLFLRRAYQKASREFPDFDNTVRKQLDELTAYELGNKLSLDEAADKFAIILKSVDISDKNELCRRATEEILYHTGRWIYIIDACDDLSDDIKYNRYNPVLLRYPVDADKLTDDSVELLRSTITHSNNLLASAFELLPETFWTDIMKNIIYLGMPDTCEHVLKGEFPPKCTNVVKDI